MNSNLEQIQKETWRKFFLLQNKIFLVSYKEFLDNFNEKLKHNDKETTAILFLKCYVDNFDSIQNNLDKTQKEIDKENENWKQSFFSSKENLEILNLSNKFVKNIKKLDTNLENLILFSFFIISLSLIKNPKQQEKIINEFINQKLDFSLKNKNDQKQFYKILEKTWKENINKIYQEFVEKENEKTKTEWEKSAFISFNYFNNLFR